MSYVRSASPSHPRGLDGHFYVRPRQENVTDGREHDVLAERFEAHRARLRAVAYQTLGSASEADEAVQEAWLRLSRTDPGDIKNLGG